MSDEVRPLRREVERLQARLASVQGTQDGYYESPLVKTDWFKLRRMPEQGLVRIPVHSDHRFRFIPITF